MKMGYWKSKFSPMFRMVFDRNAGKRSSAAEACKSFEGSKDSYNMEFEEKKAELQPKVLQIYEASSADIKTFVKERTEAGLKKSLAEVQNFLEELVKIEFPGSRAACDASSKFGATSVVEPVFFVFEKVSTLVVTKEKEAGAEAPPPTRTEKETGETEREIDIEEGKKEEKKEEEVEEKKVGAEEESEKTEEMAHEEKKEEEVEEKKEGAEEVSEKTEEMANEEKKKSVEPAAEAPTKEEEAPADQPLTAAAAVAATQVEEKTAEPATLEEEKPAESAVASTSDEPAKKMEEEAGTGAQTTTEAATV